MSMDEKLPPSEAVVLCRYIIFQGYQPGMMQPSLLVELEVMASELLNDGLDAWQQSFDFMSRSTADFILPAEFDTHHLLKRIVMATLSIFDKGGMPGIGRVLLRYQEARAGGSNRFRIAFPSVHQRQQAVLCALQAVLEVINKAAGGFSRANQECMTASVINRAVDQISKLAPEKNTRFFLQAADAASIPWSRLTGNVFQFGWGAKARLLDSAFTDQTPIIAAKIAKDKRAAAEMLRHAGIPVPDHIPVNSEQEAVDAAVRLGYPVVVKAARLDAGKGVFAGLQSSMRVRSAYREARALCNSVLVEKHVFGNDYRLEVFHGKVYSVVQRIPAGVSGDGFRTVSELVRQANEDPLRGEQGGHTMLKRMVIDSEAKALLQEQALGADSVPDAGRFVRLRNAANVSSGGTFLTVREAPHPDNLELAIRAVRLLRLDLAGVDLLIPDISRSWRESGGVICEVNSQPDILSFMQPYLLHGLLQFQGRIPVVMVVGDAGNQSWFAALQRDLSCRGEGVGVASCRDVQLCGRVVFSDSPDLFRNCMALLRDPAVDIAIMVVGDDSFYRQGMPVDRVDVLVLAAPLHDKDGVPDWARTLKTASMLAEVSSLVLFDPADAGWVAARSRLIGAAAVTECRTDSMDAVITAFLDTCGKRM